MPISLPPQPRGNIALPLTPSDPPMEEDVQNTSNYIRRIHAGYDPSTSATDDNVINVHHYGLKVKYDLDHTGERARVKPAFQHAFVSVNWMAVHTCDTSPESEVYFCTLLLLDGSIPSEPPHDLPTLAYMRSTQNLSEEELAAYEAGYGLRRRDTIAERKLALVAEITGKCQTQFSELESIRSTLSIPESEDSWDKLACAIARLTSLCPSYGPSYPTELTKHARAISRPLNSAMHSERTRLSGAALDCICALAAGLESAFEPLLPLFLPTVLALCTRSNKVFLKRANACLVTIIESSQLPTILPYLLDAVKDKAASLRLAATEGVLVCLNCFNPPDLEKEARARDVEGVIRTTARDANVDVRKASRKVFEAYKILLPDRVNSFVSPLTPITKKYLDIKPAPTTTRPTSATSSNSTSTSTSTRPHPIPHTRSAPALPASKPPPHLSSSTSALATSTAHQPHVRSASSSAISTKASTNANGKTRADGQTAARRDMPPPEYIPVRPGRTVSQQLTGTSRPVSQASSHGPSRPVSAASTRSESSATTGGPGRAATKPSAPLPVATSGPRRGNPPPPTAAPSDNITKPSGPIRPSSKPVVAPTSGAQEGAKAADRVKGGAQRVPFPPPAPAPAPIKNILPEKEESKGKEKEGAIVKTRTVSRATSVKSTPASSVPHGAAKIDASKSTNTVAPSKTTGRTGSGSGVTKANEKPKPVPGVVKPSAAAPIPSSKPSGPAQAAASASRRGGGSVTQPTLSQLSRTKPLVPRKASATGGGEGGAGSAKPGWGRPVAPLVRKGSAVSLRGKDKVGERKGAGGKAEVKPEKVPLPPSPVPEEEPEHEEAEAERREPTEIVPDVDDAAGDEQVHAVKADEREEEVAHASDLGDSPSEQEEDGQASPSEQRLPTPPIPAPSSPDSESSPPSSLQPQHSLDATRTPISALVSSIQRGFLFTPSSPLSPPQRYLGLPPGGGLFPLRKAQEEMGGEREVLCEVEGNR